MNDGSAYTLRLAIGFSVNGTRSTLKDYTGQEGGGDEAWASVMMWTWIDQELRDKMGH